MTTMSPDLDTPFALARYREGDAARIGLVVGDRIRAARPTRWAPTPSTASSRTPTGAGSRRSQRLTANGCRSPTSR